MRTASRSAFRLQVQPGGSFGFMESDVSSEKPQAVLVRPVADGMREAKAAGKKVLWVGGPGVVHTGAAPAAHGAWCTPASSTSSSPATRWRRTTSSRRSTAPASASTGPKGRGVEHGHEHHHPGAQHDPQGRQIRHAVDQGVLTGGIMHELVTHDKQFVLVGSIRDDGPLPDVHTDVIEGQRAMRGKLKDVGFCLMVATMLHSVATGNILPASHPAVCVDINRPR